MIFEKIREKLQEYQQSHLIEHDSEECLHCSERQCCETDICDMANCNVCIWDKAINIINQVEAEYNNGWTKCEDKLPEETQKSYLIYYKRHGGLNGCYNLSFVSKDYFMSDKRWEIEDRFPDAKVTHWQPLPQPPKGE